MESQGPHRHDVTQLDHLVETLPTVPGKPGAPKWFPKRLYADRAYDSEPHRKRLRDRRIEPCLAKRNTPHGSGLGVFRWVSERTIGWLHNFRRLRVRFEKRADIHEAFPKVAECFICARTLEEGFC